MLLKVILASSNKGKIREIREILKPLGIECIKDHKDIPEEEATEYGSSFLENALIKARFYYNATGIPTLAEDSGLVVEALDGDPGVKSARYGSHDGNTKLDPKDINQLILKQMEGLPREKRKAYYKVVAVLILDESKYIVAKGECHGEIAFSARGNNGFGFDEIFYLPQYEKTAAEISIEEKNKISHRAVALCSIKKQLAVYLEKNK